MKVFLRNAFLKGVPSIFVRLKGHYVDREKVRVSMEGRLVGNDEGTEEGVVVRQRTVTSCMSDNKIIELETLQSLH